MLAHCFLKEIGIAVYLMLLWKTTYVGKEKDSITCDILTPWKSWPRPPGGFLDLGYVYWVVWSISHRSRCGAGMLTHVLVAEGYRGRGIDVRARKSWDKYPEATRASLHEHTLDPTQVLSEVWESAHYFPDGVFLIGNHVCRQLPRLITAHPRSQSDELTPWLPILSKLTGASAYFSLPCCAWTLDAKFARERVPRLPEAGDRLDIAALHLPAEMNPSAGQSSYEAYRIWLGRLSVSCGWKIETDILRIPSTRNWAIVGALLADSFCAGV